MALPWSLCKDAPGWSVPMTGFFFEPKRSRAYIARHGFQQLPISAFACLRTLLSRTCAVRGVRSAEVCAGSRFRSEHSIRLVMYRLGSRSIGRPLWPWWSELRSL